MIFSKPAAVILAVIDAVIAFRGSPAESDTGSIAVTLLHVSLLFIIFGLLCIFCSDYLGEFTGSVGRGGYVDSPTPGSMFVFFGWLLLLVPVAAFLFHALKQPNV